MHNITDSQTRQSLLQTNNNADKTTKSMISKNKYQMNDC